MKYRALKPFIAFGKAPQIGEIVDLTPEQARILDAEDSIAPYEVKVMPPVENKAAKKPLQSSRQARRSRREIAKKQGKRATK